MISAIMVHVRKSVLNPPTKISKANIHIPIARIRNMTIPMVLGIDVTYTPLSADRSGMKKPRRQWQSGWVQW